jgi:gliding motility-associated-like protein
MLSAKRLLFCTIFLMPFLSKGQIIATDSSGCAPLVNIGFSGPPGATNIVWDFGDGTGSNLASPVHNFILPGTYNVTFSGNVGGNPVNYSLPITVYGKPSVKFGAFPPLAGCVPLNVNFRDSSSGGGGVPIIGREWAFGDGGVSIGNTPNPPYTYTLPGSFTVSLKITDANGCDSSLARVGYINVSTPPNAVVSTNPSPPFSCTVPLNVSFSASNSTSNAPNGGGLTYLWNFGGGNTSTLINPPNINYTTAGTFPIFLTVTDTNNCAGTNIINVVAGGPTASFFAANAVNDTVCSFVTFQNNSTGLNPWFSYGDGTFGADTFHTYSQPGTYQVTLQVQSGSCQDDTTITIVVEQIKADFTLTPTYSCSWPTNIQFTSQSINAAGYLWVFSNGNSSNAANPTHSIYESDTNQYTIYYEHWIDTTWLYVTSPHGCRDSIFKTDSVFAVTARFMPDKVWGCAPLTVAFSDSSISNEPIVSYHWIFGDGATNIGTSTNVTHTYTQHGVYHARLIVTNSAGCIDTSYIVTIHVGKPPNPQFSLSPTTVCVNTPVTFTDLTAAGDSAQYWHYNSDGGILSHCYTEPNPTWLFNSLTGPQSVSLTAVYNGCEGTTTIPNAITVKGPLAHFRPQGDCATPYTWSFIGDIQDAVNWTWDFGDGNVIANSTASSISHTYSASGDYLVKLTAFNPGTGCAPYTDSVLIYVRDIAASFTTNAQQCTKIPNSYTAAASTDVHGACHEGYLWYWGDNKPPHHTQNPVSTHIFDAGGVYSVLLVVKDINGCKDSIRQTVTAYETKSYFKPDKLYGCMPLTVNFTDSSYADTTITQWQWTFGDGTGSNLQNPSHTYTQQGVPLWVVRLIVTTALGCKDTSYAIIRPSIPDANFFIQSTNNICTGDSVKFIAASASQIYNWNFGNGQTSTAFNPSSVYNNPGYYNVSLTVTDSIGCKDTVTMNNLVYVQEYPQAGFFSSSDTLTNKCYPLLVNYTDTSIANVFGARIWDLGNGTSTVGNPTVGTIYQAPGTYTVSLIITTTNGCRDTATRSITIEGPVGNFDLLPGTICKGQSVTFTIKDTSDVGTYSWDFGDGTTAPGISPVTHTFNINPLSGQTTVSLVLWSPDSTCAATVTQILNIHPVIAAFNIAGNDSVYCLNEPISVTNTSQNATSSTWNFGDGFTFTGTTPPVHSYASPGVYNLSLVVSNSTTGCTDTLIRTLTINGIPDAQAVGGDTCLGSPVQLTASGGISYLWSPAATLNSDTIYNPVATPNVTTTYMVVVWDANGCNDTAYAEAIIYQPVDEVNWDTTIVIGQTVQLNVSQGPGYSYNWSPSAGLSCTNCPNPIAQPLVNTIYSVTIEDDAGCFSVTSTFEFEVKPLTTIDVPTAFTPDGDGINDFIFVNGLGIKKLIEFKIYNRWGQLLFETSDIKEGWNGFYRGKLQPVETYVYFASVETWLEGEILTKKGSFNLLR